MIQWQQFYHRSEIEEIRKELKNKINQYNLYLKSNPGDQIAITTGSRSIKGIIDVIKQLVVGKMRWSTLGFNKEDF